MRASPKSKSSANQLNKISVFTDLRFGLFLDLALAQLQGYFVALSRDVLPSFHASNEAR